jgi:hypothetical protein
MTLSTTLELTLPDGDAAELDQATRRLRAELLELDVESATPVARQALPSGAKAAGALEWGQLLVVLAPAVLPKLIEYLQAWSARQSAQRVKITSTVGDRSLEIDFPPGGIRQEELKALLREVQTLTEGR